MRESILAKGRLPISKLAVIGARQGWRPPETYSAHRWFARRLASAVRGLLVASQTSTIEDFWRRYREGVDLTGQTVCDPFVGGGTSIIEAQRFGANVIGVDVDAVACAITSFESRAHNVPDLGGPLDELKDIVAARVAPYYMTSDEEGTPRTILHCFWVQVVECGACGSRVDAHPHYQLAYDAEGHHQWVFCPQCGKISRLPRSARGHLCACGRRFDMRRGVVERGVLTCPQCTCSEALIEVARRSKQQPQWRPFALETLPTEHGTRVPLSERRFQRVEPQDLKTFDAARRALVRRISRLGSEAFPTRAIPRRNRADGRLLAYGYRDYSQLFNDRQLLHLSLLAEAICDQPEAVREALAIAFSDHLTTNCMMTNYAFGWRRLAPLFSIRAFRHVPRPVELNPWLDGTGRGTYPNAVRQVMRTVSSARAAMGTKQPLQRHSSIIQGDSRSLSSVASGTVDLVLTDPPYFDNIAYSELSDFYIPWLRHFGLVRSELSAKMGMRRSIAAPSRGGGSLQNYAAALTECFSHMARVLTPNGMAVFTYQHRTPQAWQALLSAMAEQRMRVIQVFPILGNSAAGPHIDDGTCQWDAVFVLRRAAASSRVSGQQAMRRARKHWHSYLAELGSKRKVRFRKTDQVSFLRACLAAAGGGMFGKLDHEARCQLLDAIEKVQDGN